MSRESPAVLVDTSVDTSVWIDFLRADTAGLRELLLALRRRELMAEFFAQLPRAREAEPAEALAFIEHHRLWGRGLQWNDVLILAAARLSGARLWAHDRRLAEAARDLGVYWSA
jgi:predicted nucleic acid-binding protein